MQRELLIIQFPQSKFGLGCRIRHSCFDSCCLNRQIIARLGNIAWLGQSAWTGTNKMNFTLSSKILEAISRPILGLFVLIQMYFSCWIQVYWWKFEFWKLLKRLKFWPVDKLDVYYSVCYCSVCMKIIRKSRLQ